MICYPVKTIESNKLRVLKAFWSVPTPPGIFLNLINPLEPNCTSNSIFQNVHNLRARMLISLSLSMSMTVILTPFRGPSDAWGNSDPPGKSMGYQQFCKILTHFGIFGPLRMKISTLPPLCFMFYYHIRFICNKEIIKIQQKNCIPLLGVAPRDLRVWPLEALVRCKKAPRHP